MSALPDPAECLGPDDVGKWHHDAEANIYYECSYDARRDVFVWASVPAVDD